MADVINEPTIACRLCKKVFFPDAIDIHEKECQRVMSKRQVECEFCCILIPEIKLRGHLKVCKIKKQLDAEAAAAAAAEAAERKKKNDELAALRAAEARGDMVPDKLKQFAPDTLSDGRVRCVCCGRYFHPEKLGQHLKVCIGSMEKNVVIFNSKAQRDYDGWRQQSRVCNVFLTKPEYERAKVAKQKHIEEARELRSSPKWLGPQNKLKEILWDSQGGDSSAFSSINTICPPSPPEFDDEGHVTCPHCHRRFDCAVALDHIPKCADIVNKASHPSFLSSQHKTQSTMLSSYNSSFRSSSTNSGFRSSSPRQMTQMSQSTGSWRPSQKSNSRQRGTSSFGDEDVDDPFARSHLSPRPVRKPRIPVATSVAAPQGMDARSASLPSLLDGGSGQPLRPGASDSVAGTGAKGAKALRGSVSTPVLHTLEAPPNSKRAAPEATPAARGRESDIQDRTVRKAASSGESPTGPALSDVRSSGNATRVALERLLSQVPRTALEKELASLAQNSGGLDGDAIVKAILAQLT